MRPSKLKHNLARLRTLLGLRQPRFAQLIDCKLMVLQNIESDRTKLSGDLAERISSETGVKLGWLLDNDRKAAAVASDDSPYTHEHFLLHQANKGLTVESLDIPEGLFSVFAQLVGVWLKAMQGVNSPGTTSAFPLFQYKLKRALDDLQSEFGCDEEMATRIANSDACNAGVEAAQRLLSMQFDPAYLSHRAQIKSSIQSNSLFWLKQAQMQRATSGKPTGRVQLEKWMESGHPFLTAQAEWNELMRKPSPGDPTWEAKRDQAVQKLKTAFAKIKQTEDSAAEAYVKRTGGSADAERKQAT